MISVDSTWLRDALLEACSGLNPPGERTSRSPEDAFPCVLGHLLADRTVQTAITDGLVRAREAAVAEYGAVHISEAEKLEAEAAELRRLAAGDTEEPAR